MEFAQQLHYLMQICYCTCQDLNKSYATFNLGDR